MKKRYLIFASLGIVFSLGAATIAINKDFGFQTYASDTREVSFYNQGSNFTYDSVTQELKVRSHFFDGTPIYMLVRGVDSLGEGNQEFNTKEATTITFYSDEDCLNDYTFQNLTKLTFYHQATTDDITFAIYYDDLETSDTYYRQIENDGVATYSDYNMTGCRNTGFVFTSSNSASISKVKLTYTCSYEWVEPSYSTIDIYASNDFHGHVMEQGSQVGLEKFGTYFKQKGAQPNTLLLDQGDTWQGSIYSNINYGNLVNDVMCEARFDARTIGNHDFDWGLNAIRANTARSYNGYTIPTLGANIYDYNFSTKQFGSTQQSDIGREYVTYTLENGLKVGIIGVIGQNQITSINSLYTQNIGFKPHIAIIKDLATELRTNQHCDVVICSIHAGQEDVKGNGLSDYVDLVLCAHTHLDQQSWEDNLLYAQFGSNGEEFGHITLKVKDSTKKVVRTEYERITASTINSEVTSIDTNIHNLVSAANASCDSAANEVIASNVSNRPSGSAEIPYLIDWSTFNYYKWNTDRWNKLGCAIGSDNPNDVTWYSWQDESSKPSTYEEGAYYFDCENGIYYHYIGGGALVNGTSFIENSGKDFYGGYFGDPNFKSYNILENVMSQAIYDRAVEEGYDIDFAYINNARSSIYGTEWTYADIYEAFPFDNTIYIIDITGRELRDEVMAYNFVCNNPTFNKKYSLDGTYRIACLDYLTFHTNSSRYYDYFPENNGNYVGTLSDNYRVILKEWLIDNGYAAGKELSAYNFSTSLSKFQKDYELDTVTATFMMNDGSDNIYTNMNIPFGGRVMDYLPSNPTRSGYVFMGWYKEASCTNPIGESTISANTSYYAKWAVGYSTGQLDYNSFVIGSESTTITVATGVDISFVHSQIVDKSSFNEFGLGPLGHMVITAPSGYKINSIEVKQYSKYENLIFHSGTTASGAVLTSNHHVVSSNSFYNVNVDATSVYIEDTYSNGSSIYYISVDIIQIS